MENAKAFPLLHASLQALARSTQQRKAESEAAALRDSAWLRDLFGEIRNKFSQSLQSGLSNDSTSADPPSDRKRKSSSPVKPIEACKRQCVGDLEITDEVASAVSDLNREKLTKHTVVELRQFFKTFGLKYAGRKAENISKLEEWLEQYDSVMAAPNDGGVLDTRTEQDAVAADANAAPLETESAQSAESVVDEPVEKAATPDCAAADTNPVPSAASPPAAPEQLQPPSTPTMAVPTARAFSLRKGAMATPASTHPAATIVLHTPAATDHEARAASPSVQAQTGRHKLHTAASMPALPEADTEMEGPVEIVAADTTPPQTAVAKVPAPAAQSPPSPITAAVEAATEKPTTITASKPVVPTPIALSSTSSSTGARVSAPLTAPEVDTAVTTPALPAVSEADDPIAAEAAALRQQARERRLKKLAASTSKLASNASKLQDSASASGTTAAEAAAAAAPATDVPVQSTQSRIAELQAKNKRSMSSFRPKQSLEPIASPTRAQPAKTTPPTAAGENTVTPASGAASRAGAPTASPAPSAPSPAASSPSPKATNAVDALLSASSHTTQSALRTTQPQTTPAAADPIQATLARSTAVASKPAASTSPAPQATTAQPTSVSPVTAALTQSQASKAAQVKPVATSDKDSSDGHAASAKAAAKPSGQTSSDCTEPPAEETSAEIEKQQRQTQPHKQPEQQEGPSKQSQPPQQPKRRPLNLVAGGVKSFAAEVQRKNEERTKPKAPPASGNRTGVRVKALEAANDARLQQEQREAERKRNKLALQKQYEAGRLAEQKAKEARLQQQKKERLAKAQALRASNASSTTKLNTSNSSSTTSGPQPSVLKKSTKANAPVPRTATATIDKGIKPTSTKPSTALGASTASGSVLPTESSTSRPTQKQGAPSAGAKVDDENNYAMSDHADSESDFSDSENDDAAGTTAHGKKIPAWAFPAALQAALTAQYGENAADPDSIFPSVSTCKLEDIFPVKKKRFRQRTSSGNWLSDKLTRDEVSRYRRDMGFDIM